MKYIFVGFYRIAVRYRYGAIGDTQKGGGGVRGGGVSGNRITPTLFPKDNGYTLLTLLNNSSLLTSPAHLNGAPDLRTEWWKG